MWQLVFYLSFVVWLYYAVVGLVIILCMCVVGCLTLCALVVASVYFVLLCRDLTREGGGTLICSAYVGSDPASALHPKKYQEFQAPQKIFEILATQRNIPILYLDLKKRP